MTRFTRTLTEEQREIVGLVEGLLVALPDLEDETSGAERAQHVPEARAALVESGVWSIGIDEGAGGGGATRDLLLAALLALGAEQPACAWAVAQAHAAAEVLAGVPELSELLAGVVAGEQPVCVVELDDPGVALDPSADLGGRIGRLDPAGEAPAVVVLDGRASAWVLAPGALTLTPPLRRTGLSGALTVSAEVDAGSARATQVTDLDVDAIRATLQLGAAAIAAGLASAAAEAAQAYSRERVQFGGPLTALPTVRAALAEQAAGAESALAAVFQTPASPSLAAVVLRDNCERAIDIAASALQSLGGYGYLREYGIERKVRDAVSLRAATGAVQAMRRIADRLAEGARP